MNKIKEQLNIERFPFADVSYWIETPLGVRLATPDTATYALLQVAGGQASNGARFAMPDERAELDRAIKSLEHVFALGRAYQAAHVARNLGISILIDPRKFSAPRGD